MPAQEIVGAIIDAQEVTTDLSEVLRASAAGCHIEYISRKRAETVASFPGGEGFSRLARAPTLFLIDAGVRYVLSGAISRTA